MTADGNLVAAAQQVRLQRIVRHAGLSSVDGAVRLPSHSNDAWRIGDTVLRICWRGDRRRLQREALLLEHVPSEVPHPQLLSVGENEGLSWMLTRWIDHAPTLAAVWETMPPSARDDAVDQLAAAMAGLHAWEPDEFVRRALNERPHAATITDVLGADVNPLPVDRALRLIEPAKHLPHVPSDVIDALAGRLESLRAIDPLGTDSGVIVHGDLHLDNVMWSGTRIAALVDFEWARLGPADLEIQPLLRPEDGHPSEIIGRLIRAHPELGAHPDLIERLWLYDLAFTLRHLLVWPPSGPASDLPEFHPLRRLPHVLNSPAYIEMILAS